MILDIVVCVVLLASMIIAYFRGFIREVLTIVGVVGGFAASYFGGPYLSPMLANWLDGGGAEGEKKGPLLGIIPHDLLIDALAYGTIFIIVVILLSLISHALSTWAKEIGLTAMDRMLGVLFGLVRGVVIIALLYMPLYVLTDDKARQDWFKGSFVVPYVEMTAKWMTLLIPEEKTEQAYDAAYEKGTTLGESARKKLQEVQTEKMKREMQKKMDDSDMSDEERAKMDKFMSVIDEDDSSDADTAKDTGKSGEKESDQ